MGAVPCWWDSKAVQPLWRQKLKLARMVWLSG